jgi:hypothetical protein
LGFTYYYYFAEDFHVNIHDGYWKFSCDVFGFGVSVLLCHRMSCEMFPPTFWKSL